MVKALFLLTHIHLFHTSAFNTIPLYKNAYRRLHQKPDIFLNMSSSNKSHKVCIHWFRNGLRFHDNECLLDASTRSETMVPLYVIDPEMPFAQTPNRKAGAIRANFILESIQEMDKKLKAAKNGSRMVVLLGKPHEVIPEVINQIQADAIYYEREPASPIREADRLVLDHIEKQCAKRSIEIHGYDTHTLHPMEHYFAHCKDNVAPSSYGSFTKIFNKLRVPTEVQTIDIDTIPPLPSGIVQLGVGKNHCGKESDYMNCPTLSKLGYDEKELADRFECGLELRGGEDCGLEILEFMMKRTQWICTFEKPKTSPNALKVDTTGLSPYVKHGCISPRRFYHELSKVYAQMPGSKLSQPPVSLHGQLMWREYNNLMGYTCPNFDKMIDNPVARQIPWDDDPVLLEAWKNARTGYPYIDAIMTQLKKTGWIHHLARHSVACFLTRGDLWQSWEKGAEVFEEELIDADWSLNNFNWQWLSCTAHFYQYFRCYSPIAFGKKTDPNGDYIRKWLPQFKNFPTKFIYDPWNAPKSVQVAAGVVIGKDYPEPIVDHAVISKSNMGRMKAAYDAQKLAEASDEGPQKKKAKVGA
jgi:cryptochrome